jgi:Uma2 family endonuclease
VPTVFDFGPLTLTDEQFESLARNHPDLNIELSAEGELIIVAPTLPYTGQKNADLTFFLASWARKEGTGIVFDSSSLFTFPNGAKRSPDAAWVKKEKWLRSGSDTLDTLKKKMAEYISNGVRLGWLIDPSKKRVHVYRANGEVEVLNDPAIVSGEDVLNGFELNVREIW